MFDRLIAFALQQRILVLAVVLLVAGFGYYSLRHIPIDAFPDLTTNQVQVLTEAPGLAPTEVESLVTYPIEVSMAGLADLEQIRSLSKYELSVVTVVFKDHVDIDFARQQVFQRLQQAKERLPRGLAEPALGPLTSGTGEIYQYTLDGPGKTAMELRTLQDWVVRPQLQTVPGVADIASFGGMVRQMQVEVDPQKLKRFGLTLHDVHEAVMAASAAGAGNFIEHNKEQYIVRGLGLATHPQDIENAVIHTHGGTPVYVRDIATVKEGAAVRQGAVVKNGEGEVVAGIVLMLKGSNAREVIHQVRLKVNEINKALPGGVKLRPFYDQSDLVAQTINTVKTNLLEGGFLVIAVLLVFLGNWRAALIVASVIPISMLFAFIGMRWLGVTANLMSLGAIDFGLLVDGPVVMIENALRRLSAEPDKPRHQVLRAAFSAMARPVFFSVLIIVMVYLPILTLQGMEGKMFSPMALTVNLALLGSLILTMTFVPAAARLFLGNVKPHAEPRWQLRLTDAYRRGLAVAMRLKAVTVGSAVVAFALSLLVIPLLGTEFLPEMDEGAIVVQPIKLPSISLPESIALERVVEAALMEFPEVESVVSRIGRADIATDPMGINLSDMYVQLKPRHTWKTARDREGLVEAFRARLSQIPGMNFNFTQPIAMRVDELISGVKSDVAIKVAGEDLETLQRTAQAIAEVVRQVPGAREVNVEQVSGQTYLNLHLDRPAMARHGLNAAGIQDAIETAVGGKVVSEIYEGQRRFDVVLRFSERERGSPQAIEGLLLDTPGGGHVAMSQVASVHLEEGPAQISRENSQRRIVVETNVSGRDIGGFVAEAQARIDAEVKRPENVFLSWGGQFENQQRAQERLAIVVPVAITLICLLLYTTFNSWRLMALVLVNLPLALIGGVLALWIRHLHLSVSASIGFIALFGIAVLNGVVLLSTIRQLELEGMAPSEAALEGAVSRLRPVLMTALVASLGFIPMAISHGTGAEVQRPLATVVIGGLISSTILTLFVLPTLYAWVSKRVSPPPA